MKKVNKIVNFLSLIKIVITLLALAGFIYVLIIGLKSCSIGIAENLIILVLK